MTAAEELKKFLQLSRRADHASVVYCMQYKQDFYHKHAAKLMAEINALQRNQHTEEDTE